MVKIFLVKITAFLGMYYVVTKKRTIEMYVKITDEVTSVTADSYLSLNNPTVSYNDTTEEFKQVIRDFLEDL